MRNESFRIFSKAPRESQIRHELYGNKDNFGDDQETPGNNQNLNPSFTNANANINFKSKSERKQRKQ